MISMFRPVGIQRRPARSLTQDAECPGLCGCMRDRKFRCMLEIGIIPFCYLEEMKGTR